MGSGKMTGFDPRVTYHLSSPGTKAQQLGNSLEVWEDDRVQSSHDMSPARTKSVTFIQARVITELELIFHRMFNLWRDKGLTFWLRSVVNAIERQTR